MEIAMKDQAKSKQVLPLIALIVAVGVSAPAQNAPERDGLRFNRLAGNTPETLAALPPHP